MAAAQHLDAAFRAWPDPRKVCAVCGAADVRFRCTGCAFQGYCGREHQRLHWKRGHKASCASLEDAVAAAVQRHRAALREKYVVRAADATCWICLEGGRPDDLLYRGGCGCRGGATAGHVRCFVAAAAATRPRPDSTTLQYSSWHACPTCGQAWLGHVRFELSLELANRWDAKALERRVDDATDATDQALRNWHAALASLPSEPLVFTTAGAASSFNGTSTMMGCYGEMSSTDALSCRVMVRRLDVAARLRGWASPSVLECFLALAQGFAHVHEYERSVAMHRLVLDGSRHVRGAATDDDDDPSTIALFDWRIAAHSLARTLVRSHMHASRGLPGGGAAVLFGQNAANNEVRREATEAERLLRAIVDDGNNGNDLLTMDARAERALALALLGRFDEARDANRSCLEDARRVYGPQHHLTTKLPFHATMIERLRQDYAHATGASSSSQTTTTTTAVPAAAFSPGR
mmetsp:Transcript_18847/g.75173  ORF Transcript_18847/g.75173 Transcript_18847/m.75173 type:complete len:464 (+) Transcript_18847:43-1434(+)